MTVTEDGLNVILQPVGTMNTERLTDPLNPPRENSVTVTVWDAGTFMFTMEGEAEMKKSGVSGAALTEVIRTGKNNIAQSNTTTDNLILILKIELLDLAISSNTLPIKAENM